MESLEMEEKTDQRLMKEENSSEYSQPELTQSQLS